MNNRIELIVNGSKLDLNKEESIILNVGSKDGRDIQSLFFDYSQQINVPATPNNNKILQYYSLPFNSYDTSKFLPATIKINGRVFREGKIEILSSSSNFNTLNDYNLNFFDAASDIITLFGDINIGGWYIDDDNKTSNRYNTLEGERKSNARAYVKNIAQLNRDWDIPTIIEMMDVTNTSEKIKIANIYNQTRIISYYATDSSDRADGAFFDGASYRLPIPASQYPVDGIYGGLDMNELKPLCPINSIFDAIEDSFEGFSFGTSLVDLKADFENKYIYTHHYEAGMFDNPEENEIITQAGNGYLNPTNEGSYGYSMSLYQKPILDDKLDNTNLGVYTEEDGIWRSTATTTDIRASISCVLLPDSQGQFSAQVLKNGIVIETETVNYTPSTLGGTISLTFPTSISVVNADTIEFQVLDNINSNNVQNNYYKYSRIQIAECKMLVPVTPSRQPPFNILLNAGSLRPYTYAYGVNIGFELPRITISQFLNDIVKLNNYVIRKDIETNTFIFKKYDDYVVNEINLDKYIDLKNIVTTDVNKFGQVIYSVSENNLNIGDMRFKSINYFRPANIYNISTEKTDVKVIKPGMSTLGNRAVLIKSSTAVVTVDYNTFADPTNGKRLNSAIKPFAFYQARPLYIADYENLELDSFGTNDAFTLDSSRLSTVTAPSYYIANIVPEFDEARNRISIKRRKYGDLTPKEEMNTFINNNTGTDNMWSNGYTYAHTTNNRVNLYGYVNSSTFFEFEPFQNWDNYINNIYNPLTRFYKFNAYLPLSVMQVIDDSFIIKIRNIKFKVNSIKMNLSTGQCQFEIFNSI